ncbi:hypothetical protein MKW94_013095 [Papaver nudicaule]|uniref:TF-B3 domain-containing protein n=1 Tax=Papaver nudicaule TaxID=74823 RepID=A0AA41VVP1_PAPNU|nr:hypothetical protein [Papaver nudicaule]
MGDQAILSAAEKQAEQIRSRLDTPSMVRVMIPSHVSGCFWLGLCNKDFCATFMSKSDIGMTLLDEQGKKYDVNYKARPNAFSGGWRGFAKDHELREGDAVVFQLIDIETFKVYIAREDGGADIDCSISLLQLKAQMAKKSSRGKAGKNSKMEKKPAAKRRLPQHDDDSGDAGKNLQRAIEPAGKRQRRCVRPAIIEDRYENESPQSAVDEQPDDDSDVVDSVVEFNNSIVDAKMSDRVRDKYYRLCCRQKSLLHTNLVISHNSILVAGIISETVKIADNIRSFRLANTSKNELLAWKKKLEAFEQLGMKVAFLIPRINEFVELAEREADIKRCRGSTLQPTKEREEEINTLEMELIEWKDASKRLDRFLCQN